MVRRLVLVVAAFMLVASLLGISTALVDQVREEVIQAQREPQVEVVPPSAKDLGLPIEEFTLLDPALANLNAVDQAGRVLTLQEPGLLSLEEGDSIQVGAITLPTASRVELPHGGSYQGSQLACPDGCLLYDQRGRLAVPPNATLVLPGTTRLPAEPGQLAPGTSYELPAGTRLALSSISMPGPTPFPLGPGTTIVLPNQGPGSPGEVSDQLVELPAGTLIRGALNETPGLEELVRESPQVQPPQVPEATGPTQPIINVTHVPETIRKGAPFTVRGTVHLPDGTPLAGHPVTVYANATKRAPGFVIQIGQVATDEEGVFRALSRINTSRPAQPYHIVAQAHARPDADPALLEAWSDPVVPVEDEEIELRLEIPRREGQRVPVTFRATLEDRFGAPVPGQRITFRVEGSSKPTLSALTDERGQALVLLEEGFPFPGTWNVSARFGGTEHLAPAKDFAHVEIIEARLLTNPTVVVPRGSKATITGELLVGDQDPANVTIHGAYANLAAQTQTREDGTFQLHFDVPGTLRVGNYSMELSAQQITVSRTVIVTVTGKTQLTAEAPPVLPLGGILPLPVRATDELGSP
ncbi:MAG: hypothetical protein R3185_05240, partial [Candidatus Thermoplasmatota archaeon]|nr:hypothetical protein [Candidatus Thermoplasmatota archaeon]